MVVENLKKAILEQIKAENEFSTVRECGMHILDIVGTDERLAKIILEDFAAGMTVQGCEKEIDAFVKKNSKGQQRAGCSHAKAEEIIRKFFGLGSGTEEKQNKPKSVGVIDLAQFL